MDFLDAQTSLFSLTGTDRTSANVAIVDDDILEGEVSFFANLSFVDASSIPVGVTINPDTATATIVDDDGKFVVQR